MREAREVACVVFACAVDGKRVALNPANVVGVFEGEPLETTTITTLGQAGPMVTVEGCFDDVVRALFYPIKGLGQGR